MIYVKFSVGYQRIELLHFHVLLDTAKKEWSSQQYIMRPLTEEETKELFEKLSKYIGENVKLLIDRPDGNYCFRLAKDRIFYVREGDSLRLLNDQ